jgi:hypothetical protein
VGLSDSCDAEKSPVVLADFDIVPCVSLAVSEPAEVTEMDSDSVFVKLSDALRWSVAVTLRDRAGNVDDAEAVCPELMERDPIDRLNDNVRDWVRFVTEVVIWTLPDIEEDSVSVRVPDSTEMLGSLVSDVVSVAVIHGEDDNENEKVADVDCDEESAGVAEDEGVRESVVERVALLSDNVRVAESAVWSSAKSNSNTPKAWRNLRRSLSWGLLLIMLRKSNC